MTSTYQTVQVTRKDADWPKHMWGVNNTVQYGPYTTPLPAVSQDRSYEPRSEYVWRMKPPHGKWGVIKKSGVIVMNPHRVIGEKTQNYVGSRRRCLARLECPTSYNSSLGICYGTEDVKLITEWTEYGDFDYWKSSISQIDLNARRPSGVDEAISAVKSSVVADFLSSYDLLTELSELRENFASIQAIHEGTYGAFKKVINDSSERDFKRAKQSGKNARQLMRSADKGLRKVGAAWMTYRYLIMPLVYSYRDISDIIDGDGLLFKSFHKTIRVDVDEVGIPSISDGTLIFHKHTGSWKVSATIKAGYTKSGLQSLTSSSFSTNPFKTAWELIPLSFVADWFVNIGDYITAHTSVDFSAQAKMCVSVKEEVVRTTYLVDKYTYVNTRVFPGSSYNKCWSGNRTLTHSFGSSTTDTLQVINYDTYDRVVFTPGDVEVYLNSNPMNWKRYLDSSVIAYNLLRNILK